jgi:hypothetical protein
MDSGGFWLALFMPLVLYGGIAAISGTQEDGRKIFYVVAALVNALLLTIFVAMLGEERHRAGTLLALLGLVASNALGFLMFKK